MPREERSRSSAIGAEGSKKGSAAEQERVLAGLESLAEEPRPDGCKKLSGRDAWRVRVGDYPVIYEVADDTHRIIVLVIAHRKDAYR